MNKKGQTLILFVLLVPIFVALAAVVVDVGTMQFTYQKYKGIVDESIKEYYEEKGAQVIVYSSNFSHRQKAVPYL